MKIYMKSELVEAIKFYNYQSYLNGYKWLKNHIGHKWLKGLIMAE